MLHSSDCNLVHYFGGVYLICVLAFKTTQWKETLEKCGLFFAWHTFLNGKQKVGCSKKAWDTMQLASPNRNSNISTGSCIV